jgi:hypothetical protein
MKYVEIETPGLERASITAGPGWKITYHQLFHLSPEQADKVVVIGKGATIWHLCFSEDLFQAINDKKGLILDVGWYPECDPSGHFRLRVVRALEFDKRTGKLDWDWMNPIVDVLTRSFDEINGKIHEIFEDK